MNEFDRSLAFLIAIDGYANGIPKLQTPVADADALAAELRRNHGFETEVMSENEATLEAIRKFFTELPNRVGSDDRVLFYFAGHGVAVEGDEGPEGFILPQDAERDSTKRFLPMVELHEALSKVKCRHMLVVLDCCFAGALRWSSTRHLALVPENLHDERYAWYVQDAAWQAIASAAHDQKALDVAADHTLGKRDQQGKKQKHSPFAAALIRGLRGAADMAPADGTSDGVITATELYLYLEDQLKPVRQTPILWPLKKHDKGQFVFLVPGKELDLPPAPALDPDANPWRGLRPYETAQSDLFFGRAEASETLRNRLLGRKATKQNPEIPSEKFIVVTGPSGIGKSSLVKAGLLPRLDNTICPILVRPGPTPFASLAIALKKVSKANAKTPDAQTLKTDATALSDWVKAKKGKQQILLVVDQAEELITMNRDTDVAKRYLQLFANALKSTGQRLSVLFTVRSEFEPLFAQSPLSDRWEAARYLVPQMTHDELRQVVEEPAAVRVMRFESEELVDRLVDEVVQMPGALPLLSFALSEMYENYLKRRSDDRTLTSQDYEALKGGVTGSLRLRANQVIDGLDVAHQATARRVLQRLVSVESGEFARRRVPRKELDWSDAEENTRIESILKELDRARLIVRDNVGNEPHIELAHDALIFGWGRLLEWVRNDAQSILNLRKLTADAEAWVASNRKTRGLLWSDKDRLPLAKALESSNFPGLNCAESDFVQASFARAKTSQFVRFSIAVILVLLTVGATWAAKIADDRRLAAERERRLAEGIAFTNAATAIVDTNPETAGLYAVHALRRLDDSTERSGPAEQVLRRALGQISGPKFRGLSQFDDAYELYSRLNKSVSSLSLSSDEQYIAYGTNGGHLYVWELDESRGRKPVKIYINQAESWRRHFAPISSPFTQVDFAFRDSWLIAQDRQGHTRIFETNNNFEEVDTPSEWRNATTLLVSPNGSTVSTYSRNDSVLRIWRLAPNKTLKSLREMTLSRSFDHISYSSDGDTILVQHSLFDYTLLRIKDQITSTKIEIKGSTSAKSEDQPHISNVSSDNRFLVVTRKIYYPPKPLNLDQAFEAWDTSGPKPKRLSPPRSDPDKIGGEVWDISGAKPIKLTSFSGETNDSTFFNFSPDGRWLAVGNRRTIKLWDVTTRSSLESPYQIALDTKVPKELIFDKQSTQLASSMTDGTVLLVDLTDLTVTDKNRTLENVVKINSLGTTSLRFSASGRWLAAGGGNTDVATICDTSRECQGQDGGNTLYGVRGLSGCSTPSNTWLVGETTSGSIRIWRDPNRSIRRSSTTLPWSLADDGKAEYAKVVCSDDNRWMFLHGASSKTKNRFLVNLTADDLTSAIIRLNGGPSEIDMAEFSPTGDWLLLRSAQQLFNVSTASSKAGRINVIGGYRGGEVRFSPNGHWLVEKISKKTKTTEEITLRAVKNGKFSEPINILSSTKEISTLEFSRDDSKLFVSEYVPNVSGSRFEKVRPDIKAFIWNLKADLRKNPQTIYGHRGHAHVEFSPDGGWVATVDGIMAQRQKKVRLWRTADLENPVFEFEMEAPAQQLSLMFDPDSRWFILGKGLYAAFYILAEIDRNSNEIKPPNFELASGTKVTARWDIKFSPDNNWMANRGRDNPLRIWWRTPDGEVKLVRNLPEQTGDETLEFSSNSLYLVFAQKYQAFSTNEQVTPLLKLNKKNGSVGLSMLNASGKVLMSDSRLTILNPRGATVWALGTAGLIDKAKRVIARNVTKAEWDQVLSGAPYEKTFLSLPKHASVFRHKTELAVEAFTSGQMAEANALLSETAIETIDSGNPLAAMRAAHAGVSIELADSVLKAADFAAKMMPGNIEARRVRGLARVQAGDKRGRDDLLEFISWASVHGANEDSLKYEISWAKKGGATKDALAAALMGRHGKERIQPTKRRRAPILPSSQPSDGDLDDAIMRRIERQIMMDAMRDLR